MTLRGFDTLEKRLIVAMGNVTEEVAACMLEKVDADAPRDTGNLACSISGEGATTTRQSLIKFRQDDGKAHYGSILDAGIRGRRNGNKHKGWWTNYPWQETFDECYKGAAFVI